MKLVQLPGIKRYVINVEDIVAIMRINDLKEATAAYIVVLGHNPTTQVPLLDQEAFDYLTEYLEKNSLLDQLKEAPKVVS